MNSSGGAAANTGIDFQQRLASYFMLHMLMEIDSLRGIGLDGEFIISEISFETSTDIDDIVITTNSGKLYLQAKRNISLSDKVESEFQKTINQFVAQHFKEDNPSDRYILATTSGASSKIKLELKKLTESIRLNDTNFKKNPLNQSEKDTFAKIKTCISYSYEKSSSNTISDTDIFAVLRKTYIVIADIQQGQPLEGAILTVLASRSRVNPEFIWSTSITLALSMATKRQSIDRKGLLANLGRFLKEQTPEEENILKNEILKIEFAKGEICSGRDVVLIESFIDDQDLLIVELKRFDKTGSKRIKYYDNKCKIAKGEAWKLLYRAGTYAGVERYVNENEILFKDKKIGIIPIKTEKDIDKSVIALAHKELCEKILESNNEPLRCLHCGDHISESGVPLIEIDEVEIETTLGLVHNRCLRAIDRVLGIIKVTAFDEYNFLKDFDYRTWFKLVQKGQGLFGNLEGQKKQLLHIAWNPEGASDQKGNYCVRINLEDGSSRFVTHRGKVVRESHDSATEKVGVFNSQFAQSREEKDPDCYTSKSGAFGKYSSVMTLKEDDEECIECISAEVANYTLPIEKSYSHFDNYYAPLFILLERETGSKIFFKKTVFVISNPRDLERYIENWKKAGIQLPDYKIEIIKSDHEFDLFVMKCLEGNLHVFANPLFDMNQNPLSGIIFNRLENLRVPSSLDTPE